MDLFELDVFEKLVAFVSFWFPNIPLLSLFTLIEFLLVDAEDDDTLPSLLDIAQKIWNEKRVLSMKQNIL